MSTNTGTILVVDDDSSNRILLATNLKKHGYCVEMAEDGQEALDKLHAGVFDIVLLDLLMPRMDGFQVLAQMKTESALQHIPVIVISAVDEMRSVIRSIEMGAADHLPKPVDPVLLHARINASLTAKRLRDRELEYLQDVMCLTDAAAAVEAETFDPACLQIVATRSDELGQLARVFQRMAREVSARQQYLHHQVQAASKDRYRLGNIIGKSQPMQQVYEKIVHAAASDATVIICGESGTGKELVARTIHRLSSRQVHAFEPVNCGAVAEGLFEREFFGHRKGAFTGADRDAPGFFDAAQGGTLFLDEIGELSPALQVKLLRALQDGEYTPVGDQRIKRMNVRIMAATNKDPEVLREEGLMRDDFFYRIYVIVITLPPLRKRKDDIPLLVEHFLNHYSEDDTPPTIPAHLIGDFMQHEWPGNIRELQNAVQRYLAGEPLDFMNARQLEAVESPRGKEKQEGWILREALDTYEKQFIQKALAQNRYHVRETADMLALPLTTLYRKIKKYQLEI